MLNFGLTEMRLVAPRDGWPNPDAGPSASGADIVLEQAQVFDTVAGRNRRLLDDFRLDRTSPRPCHAGARARADGRADRRLTRPQRHPVRRRALRAVETEDVALANAIVTVPINPEFGSLNLAQAVILLAYEWSRRTDLAQPTAKDVEATCSARRGRRTDRPSRAGARRQGLFPPALAHAGDEEHHPHHLHQDRLVVA